MSSQQWATLTSSPLTHWIGILVRHMKQSNYSSSVFSAEHHRNMFSELPTCPYLMLHYLRLRWSISLTDVCLIECYSSSWWGCCLAPFLSLPPCLAWRCTNVTVVLQLFILSLLQWMQGASIMQCKSFLRLVMPWYLLQFKLRYSSTFVPLWVQWILFAITMLPTVHWSSYCAAPHN